MDKTSSFFLGIISGAALLGAASYVMAEYLPNKRKEEALLNSPDWDDPLVDSEDADSSVTDKKGDSEEDISSASHNETNSDSDIGESHNNQN